MKTKFIAIGILFHVFAFCAHALTTNSWQAGSGKWETAGDWLHGVPSLTDNADLVTNSGDNTVTIDATTASGFPGTMTISNLTVSAPFGLTNTLYLNNPGTNQPFVVKNSLRLGSNGVFWVTNAVVQLTGSLGTNCNIDGSLILDGGTLIVMSNATIVGNVNRGTLSVNGGSVQVSQLVLGNTRQVVGVVNLSGGAIKLASSLVAGNVGGATGTMWVSGGQMVGTNANTGTLSLGASVSAFGAMTISNGSVLARVVQIGQSGAGTLTIDGGGLTVPLNVVAVGGTNTPPAIASHMVVGLNSGSTGTVVMTGGNLEMDAGSLTIGSSGRGTLTMVGGQLMVTNGPTYIGGDPTATGLGVVTVSNNTWLATDVYVSGFGTGTLTIAGGTNTLSTSLQIGFGAGAGQGTVWLTGGQLTTTSAITRIGGVATGVMTVSNGVWLANIVDVGGISAGAGTLTMFGGTTTLASGLNIGLGSGGYHPFGTLWMNGGQLSVTNAPTVIGEYGDGQMIVSDGTWLARDVYLGLQSSGITIGVGTLTVAGGTVIANSVVLGTNGSPNGFLAHGFFTVTGGTVIIGGQNISASISAGDQAGCTGAVNIVGGQFVNTNSTTIVGNYGIGSIYVSNSAVATGLTQIGAGSNSQGILTIDTASTMSISSNLTVGTASGSTGMVMLTGGSLIVSNGIIGIGNTGDPTQGSGFGQLTIANASVIAANISLGSSAGGYGTMTILPGGIVHIPPDVIAGGISWNEGILDGGVIDAPAATMWAGQTHPGEFIASNGVATIASAYIGFDNPGTLTMVGGTINVYSNLTVGDCGGGVAGLATMSGGALYVTNATHTAVLEVRSGSFLMSGGEVVADILVMTNACGLFQHSGGITVIASMNLAPNLSASGDGLPNWWALQYGLDPLNPAIAAADPLGKGISNSDQFLLGLNPTNAASVFRIASTVPTGADYVVTWTTAGPRTNVVQATNGGASGSYSNNFQDISGPIIINVVGDTTTNYLDVGGATNQPARFYRVRLGP